MSRVQSKEFDMRKNLYLLIFFAFVTSTETSFNIIVGMEIKLKYKNKKLIITKRSLNRKIFLFYKGF